MSKKPETTQVTPSEFLTTETIVIAAGPPKIADLATSANAADALNVIGAIETFDTRGQDITVRRIALKGKSLSQELGSPAVDHPIGLLVLFKSGANEYHDAAYYEDCVLVGRGWVTNEKTIVMSESVTLGVRGATRSVKIVRSEGESPLDLKLHVEEKS